MYTSSLHPSPKPHCPAWTAECMTSICSQCPRDTSDPVHPKPTAWSSLQNLFHLSPAPFWLMSPPSFQLHTQEPWNHPRLPSHPTCPEILLALVSNISRNQSLLPSWPVDVSSAWNRALNLSPSRLYSNAIISISLWLKRQPSPHAAACIFW